MKVTLVNPPYPPNAHSHPPFIPLGIAYLGAVAEQAGHEVNVIDCQAEHLTVEAFRARIGQVQPDVIGVTSTTLLYNQAKAIITAAKEVHPNATTMIGGSHVTFWDDKRLKRMPRNRRYRPTRRRNHIHRTLITLTKQTIICRHSGHNLSGTKRNHHPK